MTAITRFFLKNMINLYFGKAIDVIRVLLIHYPQSMTLRALAKESGVSLGQAFKVSKALINEGMALRDSYNYEFELMSQFVLLKRWATINNFVANTRFIEYYTPEDSDILEKLKFESKWSNRIEYAFTGLFGALLVAPFVRPTNTHIYVKTEYDAKKLANLLDLMPIEGYGNVKFAIAKSNGIFYGVKEVDELQVVSNVQLYVDLLNYPAHGEEAANEVCKLIENDWEMIYNCH